jgi:hypothetical protein
MGLFLVVILVSPMQTYFNRRDAVAASQRQQQELTKDVTQLQHESDQWNDPSYVARQARVRLGYIRPGDTLYTVLNADGTPRESASSATATRTGQQLSWNRMLWASVQGADDAQ